MESETCVGTVPDRDVFKNRTGRRCHIPANREINATHNLPSPISPMDLPTFLPHQGKPHQQKFKPGFHSTGSYPAYVSHMDDSNTLIKTKQPIRRVNSSLSLMESGEVDYVEANIFVRQAMDKMLAFIRRRAILFAARRMTGDSISQRRKAFADACEQKLRDTMFSKEGRSVVLDEAADMQRDALRRETWPIAAAAIGVILFLCFNPLFTQSGAVAVNVLSAGVLALFYSVLVCLCCCGSLQATLWALAALRASTLLLSLVFVLELAIILATSPHRFTLKHLTGVSVFALATGITVCRWPDQTLLERDSR